MLKVAAIISGSGWLLNALIEGCKKGNIDAEIALIISNANNELAIERVKQAGLSMLIINHEDYPDRETFDRKLHLVLQEYGREFICLADFNRLLSPWFVEQWWNRVINCHPSLLPAFKGMRTCSRMLRSGVKFAGCTVHFVRAPMDAGPIIIQAVIQQIADL
ncbi:MULTISPECIES: phosphoribosylglycinamide formyltransferase [unclassified Microcoleus]|uniref:phosphoribosylglycinamide formyltransferase n=1 Tax=unclassified Microcoleus TaxID=2642155 RepID=UPI002FD5376F